MDNSLLAVRDINHKYIVVEKSKEQFEVISGFLRSCMILLFYNGLKIRGLLNKLEGGILYV